MLGGVNDPPEATPFSLEAYAGVPTAFQVRGLGLGLGLALSLTLNLTLSLNLTASQLRATDVDSLIGRYTLVASPSLGTLWLAEQRLWAGGSVGAGRNLTYTPYAALSGEVRVRVSARVRVRVRANPHPHPHPHHGQAAAAAAAGEALLQTDELRFRACDEQGACSASAARVAISVRNSLRARGGSTNAREASAAVAQLAGADLLGTGVGFRLLAPPTHGANPNPGPGPDPDPDPDPNPNPNLNPNPHPR